MIRNLDVIKLSDGMQAFCKLQRVFCFPCLAIFMDVDGLLLSLVPLGYECV
jgi:hypothetical protein